MFFFSAYSKNRIPSILENLHQVARTRVWVGDTIPNKEKIVIYLKTHPRTYVYRYRKSRIPILPDAFTILLGRLCHKLCMENLIFQQQHYIANIYMLTCKRLKAISNEHVSNRHRHNGSNLQDLAPQANVQQIHKCILSLARNYLSEKRTSTWKILIVIWKAVKIE